MYDDDDVRAELARMTEGDPLGPIDGQRLVAEGQRSRRRRILGAGGASLAAAAALVTGIALLPAQAGNGTATAGGTDPAGTAGAAASPSAPHTADRVLVPPTQAAPNADNPTVLRACSANLKIMKARQDPSAPPPHRHAATDLTGWRVTARSVLANVGTVFTAVSPDGKLHADCQVYKPGSQGDAGFRSKVYMTAGWHVPSVDPLLFSAGQICDTRCDGWMVEEVGRTYPKVAKFRVESKTTGHAVDVPVNGGWYALIWANGSPRKQPDLKVTAYDAHGAVIPADPDFRKKVLALPPGPRSGS